MVAYGALFFIVPIIRLLFQTMLNQRIKGQRQETGGGKGSERAQSGHTGKLLERQALAPSVAGRAVNPERLVYTSEKSLIEQPLGRRRHDQDRRK